MCHAILNEHAVYDYFYIFQCHLGFSEKCFDCAFSHRVAMSVCLSVPLQNTHFQVLFIYLLSTIQIQ